MNLLKQSLASRTEGAAVSLGLAVVRVSVGLLIFVIHGLHKLPGGIAHFTAGADWGLANEIAEMGMPAPALAASFATLVQFVAAPLLALGIATRINAALLVSVLCGAIAQNLLAGRDPQLALLYALGAALFIFTGGGRYSLDARFFPRS